MLSKPPASHPHISPTRRGVSVTLLTRAKNPSQLVRALYLASDQVPHPFVSGKTAEDIGASLGQTLVDPSYFYTEKRWREHRRGLGLPEEPLPYPSDDTPVPLLDQLPKGTVGAVALDVRGCIACLTSTGGRTNKLVGRIGDTPHMGSGFWAEEWKNPNSTWLQMLMNKLMANPTALGISGTGDGDVSRPKLLREQCTLTKMITSLSSSSDWPRQLRLQEECSSNTSRLDKPGNTLSKIYAKMEAWEVLSSWTQKETVSSKTNCGRWIRLSRGTALGFSCDASELAWDAPRSHTRRWCADDCYLFGRRGFLRASHCSSKAFMPKFVSCLYFF